LVDQSGRILREGKKGFINPELEPIRVRIRAKPQTWTDTISNFGSMFKLAGRQSSIREFEKNRSSLACGRDSCASSIHLTLDAALPFFQIRINYRREFAANRC
jgi:hypothetical protein